MASNPQLIVIEVMPVVNGGTATLTLASATTGVVGAGKDLEFKDVDKPMSFLLKLVSAAGWRFPPDPKDAAWFAPGNGNPTGPGTAGGRFDPKAVSTAGDALLVHAHGGPSGVFAALLRIDPIAAAAAPKTTTATTTTTYTRLAAISGGPIIIND